MADRSQPAAPGCVRITFLSDQSTAVYMEEDLGPDLSLRLDVADRDAAINTLRASQDVARDVAARERIEQQERATSQIEATEGDRGRLARIKAESVVHYHEERQRTISVNHARYFTRAGYEYAPLVRLVPLLGASRTTVCWACGLGLDSEVDDQACQRCRWIVCLCGACGCGHPKGVAPARTS